MEKEMVVNVMELPVEQLRKLYEGESVANVQFCEKTLERQAGGFCTNRIICKKDGQYFKFLAISYLEEELTFTKPFQVFKTEEQVTQTFYSNWVDVAESDLV